MKLKSYNSYLFSSIIIFFMEIFCDIDFSKSLYILYNTYNDVYYGNYNDYYDYYNILFCTMKLLIDNGADINIQDPTSENTILHIECDKDINCVNYDLINLFLNHPKMNINIKNKEGNNILFYACINNNIFLFRLLLSNNKNYINYEKNLNNYNEIL